MHAGSFRSLTVAELVKEDSGSMFLRKDSETFLPPVAALVPSLREAI